MRLRQKKGIPLGSHLLLLSKGSGEELFPDLFKAFLSDKFIPHVILFITQVRAADAMLAADAIIEVGREAAVFAELAKQHMVAIREAVALKATFGSQAVEEIHAIFGVAHEGAVVAVFTFPRITYHVAVFQPPAEVGEFAVDHFTSLHRCRFGGFLEELVKLIEERAREIIGLTLLRILDIEPVFSLHDRKGFFFAVGRDDGFPCCM